MYTEKGTLDLDVTLERYAPLVHRIAHQMRARLPASVMLGDLIQAGMIGLLEAASRYDDQAGAQFETFATQRVRGAMLDELRGKDWLPRSARRAQRDIEQAIGKLQQALMRAPTEDEIATELGLSVAEYQKMLVESCCTQLVYLDDLTEQATQLPFLDRHVEPEARGLLTMLGDDQFRAALTREIEKLPEREQQVMSMYYEQDMTLKEIGLVFDVTESRISQLHSQAVARIREGMTHWK